MAKVTVPITMTINFNIESDSKIQKDNIEEIEQHISDAFFLWIEDFKQDPIQGDYGLSYIIDHITKSTVEVLDDEDVNVEIMNYSIE